MKRLEDRLKSPAVGKRFSMCEGWTREPPRQLQIYSGGISRISCGISHHVERGSGSGSSWWNNHSYSGAETRPSQWDMAMWMFQTTVNP